MSVSFGFGPENPNKGGWNLVPPPRSHGTPTHSIPLPTFSMEQWCSDGQEQTQELRPGREWKEVWGQNCCCPGQVRQEGRGLEGYLAPRCSWV